MLEPIEQIKQDLAGLRCQVLDHPLYAQLQTLKDLRVFMSHHVFAVWDFMSLLKRLQRDLTCVDLPWVPKGSQSTRRFINEIVLGEESDEDGRGNFYSHFELYLQAMTECGADQSWIHAFLEILTHSPVPEALVRAEVPHAVKQFVESTWRTVANAPVHAVAAAFTLGREDLIPDLFRALVERLHQNFPDKLARLRFYLTRHIEVDEGHHTPLAIAMLSELCGRDERRWQEARDAASQALQARFEFWSAILQTVRICRNTNSTGGKSPSLGERTSKKDYKIRATKMLRDL